MHLILISKFILIIHQYVLVAIINQYFMKFKNIAKFL